ncbi:hypothetical protein [Azospirillum tabaci]|uniref:hypothetical protein n=1 Tax=Azospirillum tabaci TaxID=2752310 RepID=UPI001660F8AB|nr:hypothetical protein [Azospirillum tabaci]
MTTQSDLRAINGDVYNPNTNPGGLDGPGGMEANFPKALGLIAQGLDDMAAYISQANFLAAQASVATILQLCQALVAQITSGSTTALAFPGVDKLLLSATDVVATFVYDTRLDDRLPDGGRWNEPGRCSGTSWWHETLGTATRGVKRDFPAVALLVLRNTSNGSVLTVYDALDLDATGAPRLWISFGTTVSGTVAAGATYTSVHALNGTIWVGGTTQNQGLTVISLTRDRSYRMISVGATYNVVSGLVNRNANAGISGSVPAGLASADVFGVHARVLPGAPLDQAGLPIPTVAVATAGGASIIHPTGMVATLTEPNGVSRVQLNADATVTVGYAGGGLAAVHALPYATRSLGSGIARLYGHGNSISSPQLRTIAGDFQYRLAPGALGSAAGLTHLAEDVAYPARGMVAYATPTYATGWMHGSTVFAALCDARTGGITGGELARNGDLSAGTSDWTPANRAALSVGGGKLRVAHAGTINPAAYQIVATVVGETYQLVADATQQTSDAWQITLTDNTTGAGVTTGFVAGAATGRPLAFTATSTATRISLIAGASVVGQYSEFDNVSLQPVSAGRSYQGKGCAVVGTLQRTPAASGSDVVMWSGWASNAYLEQPYNSDLDFGTGDFWLAAWTTATIGTVIEHGTSGLPTGLVRLAASGGTYTFTVVDSATASGGVASATPTLLIAQRAGGVLELWVNGSKVNTATGPAISTTLAGAVTRIGCAIGGAAPADGGIAMVRSGAGALSPAQIRQIYEDEVPLLQAGAKCLLGGTNGGVNAMDRDPLTGRLAVGTGDGVSIFRGLRRVSYFDEAVLAATTSDAVRSVSLRGGALLIGTGAEVGFVADAVPGKEAIFAGDARPVGSGFSARGVTTDATPLDLASRIFVGERETVLVEARIIGRVYGVADTERLTYVRRATCYRDAGGNVTLQGAAQNVGSDTEVTSTADASLIIDTAAQTIAARVTGVAGKRIRWEASITVTRISEENNYAA